MESEKVLYSMTTKNPDTGRSDDLLSTVQAAQVYLHEKAIDRGKSRVGRFSLSDTLKDGGFEPMTAHFMLLLYELGVVAKVKRTDKLIRGESIWEYLIAPFQYSEAMLSQSRIDAALQELADRKMRNYAATQLKKLQSATPDEDDVSTSDSGVTLDQLAEAVAAAECVTEERDALAERVAELEAELAKAEKVDPAEIAEALLAKVRKK